MKILFPEVEDGIYVTFHGIRIFAAYGSNNMLERMLVQSDFRVGEKSSLCT